MSFFINKVSHLIHHFPFSGRVPHPILAKPEDTPYHGPTVEYHLPSSLVGLVFPSSLSKPSFCPPHRQSPIFDLFAEPCTLHYCNIYHWWTSLSSQRLHSRSSVHLASSLHFPTLEEQEPWPVTVAFSMTRIIFMILLWLKSSHRWLLLEQVNLFRYIDGQNPGWVKDAHPLF